MGTYFIFTIKASVCLMAFCLLYKHIGVKRLSIVSIVLHCWEQLSITKWLFLWSKMTTAHTTTINTGIVSMGHIFEPQTSWWRAGAIDGRSVVVYSLYTWCTLFYRKGNPLCDKLQMLLRKGHIETIDEGIKVIVLDEHRRSVGSFI